MTQIPQDWAHQRIVLGPKLLVRKRTQQEEGALPGLSKIFGDGITAESAGSGNGGHRLSSPGKLKVHGSLSAMIRWIWPIREIAVGCR
jgi:hypothetical protein